METCDRGQGSRGEGTAVRARNSASDPAGQAPGGRAECRALQARAHLDPAPARGRRAALAPAHASLHTCRRAEGAGSGLGQPPRGALIAQRRARGLRERGERGSPGRGGAGDQARAPSTLSPRQSRRHRRRLVTSPPAPAPLPPQPAPSQPLLLARPLPLPEPQPGGLSLG